MVQLTKKMAILLCMMGSLTLTACDQLASVTKSKVECNDDQVKQQVQKMFIDRVNELNKNEIKHWLNDGQSLDISRLGSLMNQLTVKVDDVRTTHSDKQSSKQQCEAVLSIALAGSLIDEANEARQLSGDDEIQQQALLDDIKFESNVLYHNLTYTVQPTDDGQKLYTQLENVQKIGVFVSQIMINVLSKPLLEDEQRVYEEMQKAEQQQLQAEAEENAKNRAEYVSVLETEAKQELENANTKLNLVWNATTKEIRQELLPAQRTWLKKRSLECKIDAQDAAQDEKEIERLKCETKMTHQRTAELRSIIASME